MSDWKICKLGEIADVKLSNVDKKTNSDEISVRLCNYTDVYKNDFINAHKAETFMVASCNDNEFEKFILRKGQVAITKDSEKRDDIGISTYISEDFEDVVLGYHLSLITPNENHLDGRFLHYWFNTQLAKTYFENNAGGSGQRCTLPIDIIKSIPVHLPEIEIQKRISSILSKLEKKIEINNRINDNLPQRKNIILLKLDHSLTLEATSHAVA
ncbi:restriction endonuclease subunit S [Chryseobacterium sp. RR2-3-20]|uniref:restriction endonuclease subunit S n=1 Tax=Chryseobacterium sp. RR2-3-20 TaxID=2787626 RepID=UPI001ADED6B6|nr:restriction endonuclease subunit S [Chryseobacterium sp. RR2-3-20]